MKSRLIILLFGGLILLTGMQSCTDASAGNVRQDFEQWLNNVLTPTKSTLEKANTGYTIAGTLKNKPKNLVLLWEMQPTQLVFLDSVRTDESGKFNFTGNLKEPLFCELQFGENNAVYMFIDNKTHAVLEINPTDMSYSIQGKGTEGSIGLKELIDLNTSYAIKFGSIKSQMDNLPQTQESYEKGMALQAQYNQLVTDRNNNIKAFSLKQQKSLIPYFIIAFQVLQETDMDLLKHALDQSKAFSSVSKYTLSMDSIYKSESKLAIGAVAPELKMNQPNGEALALSKLRGKIVMVDFWASWCGPCRRENPFNTQLYKKYKSRGFEIYGVSLDNDPARWKQAIAHDSLVWYHVSDLAGWQSAAAKMYKVTGIPNTYLLDKNGKILAKGLRGEALEAKLAELLDKK